MIVVADSTPLIALARIDQLNLLKELFGAVLIPEAVFREVVTRGKARLAAEFIGLRFIGTAGLLLLAKKMGKISAVRPLLDQLKSSKFHISESTYHAILEQAEET